MSEKQPAKGSFAAVVQNLKVKVRHVNLRQMAEDEACDDTRGEVLRKVTPRPQSVPAGPAPDPSQILNRR